MDDSILQAKLEEAESSLRSIGLYLDRSRWIVPGADEEEDDPQRPKEAAKGAAILLMSCLVGDLAFSTRVQEPEQVDFDASFRRMKVELEAAEAEELRKRMAAGEDTIWEDL